MANVQGQPARFGSYIDLRLRDVLTGDAHGGTSRENKFETFSSPGVCVAIVVTRWTVCCGCEKARADNQCIVYKQTRSCLGRDGRGTKGLDERRQASEDGRGRWAQHKVKKFMEMPPKWTGRGNWERKTSWRKIELCPRLESKKHMHLCC